MSEGILFIDERRCKGDVEPVSTGTPCPPVDVHELPEPQQIALDLIEEASMESFPCSDPPAYTMSHS